MNSYVYGKCSTLYQSFVYQRYVCSYCFFLNIMLTRFILFSIAILRYLCREHSVDDHWYPKDSKAQARVDEYLEWQHVNTRLSCAMYFQHKVCQQTFVTVESQFKVR